jgi:acyl-CoA synthetase (AMP-forming)/AMP-acid ligase II
MMAESVYDLFAQTAARAPGRSVLCYPATEGRGYCEDGFEISYAEAKGVIDALAKRYVDAGYRPGHRVALAAGNMPEHFWHYLALNSIGATAVTLNPDYLPDEMAYGIGFPECALVVASPQCIANIRKAVETLDPAVPVFDLLEPGAPLPAPGIGPHEVPADKGKRIALIIYTSGTTSKPKGCLISNASCLAAADSYTGANGPVAFRDGGDRLYIPLPAFHMNVTVFTLTSVLKRGNCLVMQDRFRASRWWRDLVETKATCFHYLGIIPPLLVNTPETPEEKQHVVRYGYGAGIEPAIRDLFEERFNIPLVEAWGMTETSRAIMNSEEPRSREARAFGRPHFPWEVRIVDENDQDLPHGAPGELIVRASGPDPRAGFFSGYLKQEKETEEAWRGGWFHTGDICRQDPDGMLYFVDRRKNIIRRSGENIAAAEVENALVGLPEVKAVAVLAVADELHDEEIMACVVPMEGIAASRETAEAIQRGALGKVSAAKLPAWIAFRDKLPVTGTQKIQKGALFPDGGEPRTDPRSIDLREEKRSLRVTERTAA